MSATSMLNTIRTNSSPAKAWLRALELTKPIASQPERILPAVIEEAAMRLGDAPDRKSVV